MAVPQSAFTSRTITAVSPEWMAQRERIRLGRTLVGGTNAMQSARESYLPKRPSEDNDEYEKRLRRSKLFNKYKQTIHYLVGQVFQRQIKYQEDTAGKAKYDKAFFDSFQENVDTRGTNMSMFGELIFRAGMMDGVTFILSDYPSITQSTDEYGRTYYKNVDGEWLLRTAQADAENGWNPYWVHVEASQVLDAWLDNVDGKTVLRSFRYLEKLQREGAEGLRIQVDRIRAIFPDHWEVWEREIEGEHVLVKYGVNSLGIIPVDWFMPGGQTEETPGLTAIPALDDLAHMNLAHWQAYSDHLGLMPYVRSPIRVFNGIEFPTDPITGEAKVNAAPGMFLANLNPDVTATAMSYGVDPASVDRSFQDLKALEEYMSVYDLSLIMPRGGHSTATQMQIAAASANSALKGWVQRLQDCFENAIKKIALWTNQQDGPGLFVNDEFLLPYDSSALQQLSGMVDRGQVPLFVLYETVKKMGMVSENMTFEDSVDEKGNTVKGYLSLLADDAKRNTEKANIGFTPSFGNIPHDGQSQYKQSQQTAPMAQG